MILDEIVACSQERALNLPCSFKKPSYNPKKLSDAIKNSRNTPVIAELKFASPSKGVIREKKNPIRIANELVNGGCCGLSVLTEPSKFAGTADIIPDIRNDVNVPILRKDFIVDIRQLDETRYLGADAVLLITSILGEETGYFVDESIKRGIEPVLEVNSRQEARMAADTKTDLVLINNRDLKTFKTDLTTTRRVSPVIMESGKLIISASGIIWPCDIRSLRSYADSFLIGSSIMMSKDPRRRLEGFISA